ncbi:hypothetical protein ACLKMH_16760 [Psychromonas sp. KJ10-10]|uniref:hypothetical protein n=1 Tax=Psychromonas sp. KJ10-10 TaxID=3391823 RepID=UPI0039B42371
MSKEVQAKLDLAIGGVSTAGKRELNQDAFAVKQPNSYSEKSSKVLLLVLLMVSVVATMPNKQVKPVLPNLWMIITVLMKVGM